MNSAKAKKRGLGRPVTTGSDSTKPVQFRVAAIDRERLEREAAAAGTTVGLLAKARTLGETEATETVQFVEAPSTWPENLSALGVAADGELRLSVSNDGMAVLRLRSDDARNAARLATSPGVAIALRDEAYAVIDLALAVLRGDATGARVGCLSSLEKRILSKYVNVHEADLLNLRDLVAMHEPAVRFSHGDLAKAQGAALWAQIKQVFPGEVFDRLKKDRCVSGLDSLSLKHGHGRRTVNGVVADLILDVGAWGYGNDGHRDRARLLKDLDNAEKSAREPRRGRKAIKDHGRSAISSD